MKIKNKAVRVAVMAAFFVLLFSYQMYDYINYKDDNLYQLLELKSPYVSAHQIQVGFEKAKSLYNPLEEPEHQGRFDKIIAAHKCLKRQRCRDQYTRYNLAIDLPDDPNVEIDWRLGFTILFYMGFAFTQSILGSKEQKPGIRIAMGLGIMFCIDEILISQDISAFIKEGQKTDPSVQRVLQLFPQDYCTFEVAMLSRLVYFLAFNVICSFSITYVLNDDKERIEKSEQMRKNMYELTELTEKIYKEFSGKEIDSTELDKKEYLDVRNKAMNEMGMTLDALKQGKTKEELKDAVKNPPKKNYLSKIGGFVVIAALAGRYIYTQYQKSQLEAGDAEVRTE